MFLSRINTAVWATADKIQAWVERYLPSQKLDTVRNQRIVFCRHNCLMDLRKKIRSIWTASHWLVMQEECFPYLKNSHATKGKTKPCSVQWKRFTRWTTCTFSRTRTRPVLKASRQLEKLQISTSWMTSIRAGARTDIRRCMGWRRGCKIDSYRRR